MDAIELQKEAVKLGYTLVNQQYLHDLSRVAHTAKDHVDAVHDVMASAALMGNAGMPHLRKRESDLFMKLVEAIERLPWTDSELDAN